MLDESAFQQKVEYFREIVEGKTNPPNPPNDGYIHTAVKNDLNLMFLCSNVIRVCSVSDSVNRTSRTESHVFRSDSGHFQIRHVSISLNATEQPGRI